MCNAMEMNEKCLGNESKIWSSVYRQKYLKVCGPQRSLNFILEETGVRLTKKGSEYEKMCFISFFFFDRIQ